MRHLLLNDTRLLSQIQAYPHRAIGNAATKAFNRHLWYLSEHLVGLALFDAAVKEMAQETVSGRCESYDDEADR